MPRKKDNVLTPEDKAHDALLTCKESLIDLDLKGLLFINGLVSELVELRHNSDPVRRTAGATSADEDCIRMAWDAHCASAQMAAQFELAALGQKLAEQAEANGIDLSHLPKPATAE